MFEKESRKCVCMIAKISGYTNRKVIFENEKTLADILLVSDKKVKPLNIPINVYAI